MSESAGELYQRAARTGVLGKGIRTSSVVQIAKEEVC